MLLSKTMIFVFVNKNYKQIGLLPPLLTLLLLMLMLRLRLLLSYPSCSWSYALQLLFLLLRLLWVRLLPIIITIRLFPRNYIAVVGEKEVETMQVNLRSRETGRPVLDGSLCLVSTVTGE